MWQKLVNYFKSYNAGSLGKRSIILAAAIILMPLGIACYYQCGLGTDPYSVFVDGEHYLMNLSYGWVTNIDNAVLLILMIIIGRKYLNIGTIINCLVSGTLIDLFNGIVIPAIFPEKTLVIQIILLVAGLVIFAAGVGLYMIADLGIGALECMNLKISEKTKIDIKWVRIAIDVLFTIVGVVLGLIAGKKVFDLIGVGTIVGAFGTGIVMKWTINLFGKPCEKWFGPLRKTEVQPTE